ncbi:hypothetical protein C1280_07260 [Gemmata obscuriglobus]|uniref:Uncharacterized protein n=1 Tax=Gemmata obscuriglobus TaxID=114 RepID=A0A2Z3H5E4_9BACT|nr:hypothetical protein C1280_07260 [Gemmata obscuriglobus]
MYELAYDTLRISYRVSAPRSLRTLEFKAGVEEALAGSDAAQLGRRQTAGSLLELKRAESP